MTAPEPLHRGRSWELHLGDALDVLPRLPPESFRTCVTSPPYWRLRSYGEEGQLGLEETPTDYVRALVRVFREVRRLLSADGTLWLILGDSYAGPPPGRHKTYAMSGLHRDGRPTPMTAAYAERLRRSVGEKRDTTVDGVEKKSLLGIPWRVAFGLQEDGWLLRSDIVWSKPNPMPESVADRPTKSHEYIFLFAKSGRYHYDADAVREPHSSLPRGHGKNSRMEVDRDLNHISRGADRPRKKTAENPHLGGRRQAPEPSEPGAFHPLGRNKRDVWWVATEPSPFEHFAAFPRALVRPCILAGSAPGMPSSTPSSAPGPPP